MTENFRLHALLASALVLAAVTVQGTMAADEQFVVTSIIQLPAGQSLGSFDIGFVDPVRGIYILADRTNKSVDVVDTRTNTVINQLTPGFVGFTGNNDTSGPNGVLIVNHSQVWAGDGDSTLKLILLGPERGQLIATINTGGTARADELCYDPNDHVILVANDADTPPFITFVSSTSHAILGQIKMDGNNSTPQATNGIEQCQWSPRTGKFYLNIPQVAGTPGANDTSGVVLQIDPVSREIENTFSSLASTNCRGNQGMAIGPDHQILLGCSNSGTDSVIIDERTGEILIELPGESGSDEVWYNPGDIHYFLANGNHKTGVTPSPQLGVVDPSASEGTNEDPSATSARGSHSVAADPLKNQVYVPVNNAMSGGALSGICGAHGGDDSKGCLAVLTKTND
jgi:hypothetical protein